MSRILFIHNSGMTDEKIYQNLKKAYAIRPDLFINPEKWKHKRMEILIKEGRNWTYE